MLEIIVREVQFMKSRFYTNYTQLTFLKKIKDSLLRCESFSFSVSFIKKAGLILILNEIKSALKRGAKGKIITSTYQNFTDVSSLKQFLSLMDEFDNFECHLDYNSFGENGFHSKGYIFEYIDSYEVVIGSSNLTRFALFKNIEWNVSVSLKEKEVPYLDIIKEFDELWDKTYILTKDLIKKYAIQLDYAIEKWDMDYVENFDNKIVPNYMQRKALKEIRRYRDMGVNKALVVAATGSGKTYLAAFDARNFDAKKVLFIVHRDTILKEAMMTFTKVFGKRITYGLFLSGIKQIDCDFLFSTNITMSKNLELFKKDEFDYIVIDEVHHAVADTYKKIIDYFAPQFTLGLTATPERMDNESVFDLFEKNVPYELRLRDALENDLIVPFKYYGINDKLVDYSENDARILIRQIADDLHVEFIKKNIEKYRPLGKLKAIGFCRSIEHAKLMMEKMNNLGYHTTYLIGKSDTGERLKAFSDLQDDLNRLEIIFTVDLLNEGVDIPSINMVMFLRPTESSTIFIQQLGRGLRKYEGKDYLTVLDFIGNSYTRSVQIAIAMGSLSDNIYVDKRMLADFVINDFKQLQLPIEIHIDELSKEEILKSIENTNFNSIQFLKQDYYNFKKFLNIERYPNHIDFINSDVAFDLLLYVKKYGSYYNFLLIIKDDVPFFDQSQMAFLKYLSSFLPLIRPYEYLIVNSLLISDKTHIELIDDLKTYEYFDINRFNHALNNLQNKYYSKKEQELLINYIIEENGIYRLLIDQKNNSFIEHIKDLLDYGLTRFETEFYGAHDAIKLYYSYTRATLLQALCNHTFAFREGLMWKDEALYLFIDLKKDASKEEWLLYEDKFKSSTILQWESSTSTTMTNKKGMRLINQKDTYIFVRKIKSEDGNTLPYIYIGKGQLTNPRKSKNIKSTLLFDIILDNEIPNYLKYDFQIPEEKIQ